MWTLSSCKGSGPIEVGAPKVGVRLIRLLKGMRQGILNEKSPGGRSCTFEYRLRGAHTSALAPRLVSILEMLSVEEPFVTIFTERNHVIWVLVRTSRHTSPNH